MTVSATLPPSTQKPYAKGGAILKKLRKKANFDTLQSFCNRFNELFGDVELKTATLSRYEQGYMRPSKRRFERFCTTLGLELDSAEIKELGKNWGVLREVKIHEPHVFSGKRSSSRPEKPVRTQKQKEIKLVSFDPEKFPELQRYLELCEKNPFTPEKTKRLSKKGAVARMERFLKSL